MIAESACCTVSLYVIMPIETTYTRARANFADLWDRVTEDQETVIVKRRGHDDIALVSASELTGLLETAHLMRSPENATRLLKAMRRAKKRSVKPKTVDVLRRETGLEKG